MRETKSRAVIIENGRAVALADTRAANGKMVSYGYAISEAALLEVGRGNISRSSKYLRDENLMYFLSEKPTVLVNDGGGEVY